MAFHSVADPRVPLRVDYVDGEVGDHDDERGHQDVELHEVDVKDVDRLERGVADARDAEDDLDDDDPTEEEGREKSGDRDRGEEGVPQGVPVDHTALLEPLR